MSSDCSAACSFFFSSVRPYLPPAGAGGGGEGGARLKERWGSEAERGLEGLSGED